MNLHSFLFMAELIRHYNSIIPSLSKTFTVDRQIATHMRSQREAIDQSRRTEISSADFIIVAGMNSS